MPDLLETTVDKFTFRVATDRLYTRQGVWVQPDAGAAPICVRIGLADFLQQRNGDVAFAHVKPAGTRWAVGELLAEIETMKAMVEVPAPVAGVVVEVNSALETTPEVINQDPYGNGWLAVVEPARWETDRAALLAPEAYLAVMKAEAEAEANHL